jgi:hypothetical protein
MLGFIRKLFIAAAGDTVRSMGTTILAVGGAVVVWFAAQFEAGGLSAVKASLDFGLFLAVLFWLAVLAWHARKRFRPMLREHRRVFELLALSQDQTSDQDRVFISCLLRFTKDLPMVNLTVRVKTSLPLGEVTNVVHSETLQNVSQDSQKRLRLGSLRVVRPGGPPVHSIWGSVAGTQDLKPGQVSIMTDARHMVEISAGSQVYRCLIEFVTPPPGAASAAMYMTDEDRTPALAGSGRAPSDTQWGFAFLATVILMLAASYYISERRWPFLQLTFAQQLTADTEHDASKDSNLKDALINDLSPGALRIGADLSYRPGVTLYVASFTNPHDGAQFLGVYIPRAEDTVALAEEFIKKHRDVLKRLVPSKNELKSSAKGQIGDESTDNAVFTGRIFIYYEKILTLQELQTIEDAGKAIGVNVLLRGPAWLSR